ncbi:MAG: glutamate racemase [Lachnospiraceae bacterium]|nr:glutamate racemase [Lachnospiraceae bacterium]
MRIGFFDSGIGGVSVLAEALAKLPDQEYLFYADVDHVPYGEKTTEEIARFATENARFLLSAGADAIVVACNTATAVAIQQLRCMTDVPVIGMEPAVKPAVEELEEGGARGLPDGPGQRVLVAATPVTLREAKLRDLIARVDRHHCVDLLPLPGLVQLAEREIFDGQEARTYLEHAFSGIDRNAYSALVLGCTHFIYFKPLFRELLGNSVHLVDGNAGTVRRLMSVLGMAPAENDFDPETARIAWYRSGRPVTEEADLHYFGRLLARAGEVKKTA